MLTVYGSDLSGPANKVRFVANHLALNYEYKQLNLRGGEQKEPWFLAINPVGKVPAIKDDDFCLFESNAICKYLCDKQGSALYPKSLKERATVDQWVDFSSLHIMANVSKVMFNRVFAKRVGLPVSEESIADGLKFLAQQFPVIEEQLTKHDYVAGQTITLADMALLSSIDPCHVCGIELTAYPKLQAWQQRLMKEPFYTKCFNRYGEALK